jgi:hypothetical protein
MLSSTFIHPSLYNLLRNLNGKNFQRLKNGVLGKLFESMIHFALQFVPEIIQ